LWLNISVGLLMLAMTLAMVASLLFLPESVYHRPGDNRPIMGISIWTQYVLDNFATVREAVDELKKESFRIDAPDLPNGAASTLHLAITDETGNTAVLEYIDVTHKVFFPVHRTSCNDCIVRTDVGGSGTRFCLLHTHGGYGSQCNSYCLYWFIHLAFVFMN
jgi:hypothetical protein